MLPPVVTSPPQTVALRTFGSGRRSSAAISMVTTLVLLLLWWSVTQSGAVAQMLLPGPLEVWATAVAIWHDGYANGSLLDHVGASLSRVGVAWVIAVVLGVPVGLLMGLHRWVKGILDVPIGLYWPLPPLAYLPLMIIWLGIGETSKIALLTLAMFAPIVLSVRSGVSALPLERVHAAQSLGAGRWQMVCAIVLPSALPEIMTGIRVALGVGWSTLVAAELIASTRGIGYMTLSASHFLATDAVFVGIGLIAACAFGCSWVLRMAERILVPWHGKG